MERYKLHTEQGTIEVSQGYSQKSDSSIFINLGDTTILVVVCVGAEVPYSAFTPLMVHYQEKMFSIGKIPGNIQRREGKLSEREILTARIIDRSIRPIISSYFKNEVQIIVSLLSLDDDKKDIESLAIIGAYIALNTAGIPLLSHIAPSRISMQEGVFSSDYLNTERSEFNLLLVGSTDKKAVMIDFQGKQVSEDNVCKAVEIANKYIEDKIQAITQIIAKLTSPTGKIHKDNTKVLQSALDTTRTRLIDNYSDQLSTIKSTGDAELLANTLAEQLDEDPKKIFLAVQSIRKQLLEKDLFEKQTRLDNRAFTEVRTISIIPSFLKKPHGSCLFSRGFTTVLAVSTIDSPCKSYSSYCLANTTSKFFVHYNFPSYSVGEIGHYKSLSRREIGHGFLAKKGIISMIPENFPMTIRLTSDILSADGSTSLATVSGGCIALAESGVPLEGYVAGVSIGLIEKANGIDFITLTDISAEEDFLGQMDCKIIGSTVGINAIQLDVKRPTILNSSRLTQILQEAKDARHIILDAMNKCEVLKKKDLPSIRETTIPERCVKNIIGPGGATIKKLMQTTSTIINIQKNVVQIFSENPSKMDECLNKINDLAFGEKIPLGSIQKGEIIKILKIGYLVKLSNYSNAVGFLQKTANMSLKQKLTVLINSINEKGTYQLSLIN